MSIQVAVGIGEGRGAVGGRADSGRRRYAVTSRRSRARRGLAAAEPEREDRHSDPAGAGAGGVRNPGGGVPPARGHREGSGGRGCGRGRRGRGCRRGGGRRRRPRRRRRARARLAAAPARTASAAGAKPVVIPAVSGSSMAAAQQLSQSGLPADDGRGIQPQAGRHAGRDQAAGRHLRSCRDEGPSCSYQAATRSSHSTMGRRSRSSVPPANRRRRCSRRLACRRTRPAGAPTARTSCSCRDPRPPGSCVLLMPDQQGAQPVPLTGPGSDDHDPAFAPTTSQRLLAFIDESGGGSRLCFAIVGPNQLNPDCTSHPGWTLGRPGRVVARRHEDPRVRHQERQQRPRVRADRVREQRRVLDAGVAVGPGHGRHRHARHRARG